jgi:ABC-type uncharacterized transport system ATPase subunit
MEALIDLERKITDIIIRIERHQYKSKLETFLAILGLREIIRELIKKAEDEPMKAHLAFLS